MPSSCLGMQRRAGLWPPVHGAYPYMGADGSNGQTPGLSHLVTETGLWSQCTWGSCLVDRLGASQETVEPAGVVKTGSSLSCSARVHQEGALSTSAAGVRGHTGVLPRKQQ